MAERGYSYLNQLLDHVPLGDITLVGEVLQERRARDGLSFEDVLEEQILHGAPRVVIDLLAYRQFTAPEQWDSREGSKALARAYEASVVGLENWKQEIPHYDGSLDRNIRRNASAAKRLRREAGLPDPE